MRTFLFTIFSVNGCTYYYIYNQVYLLDHCLRTIPPTLPFCKCVYIILLSHADSIWWIETPFLQVAWYLSLHKSWPFFGFALFVFEDNLWEIKVGRRYEEKYSCCLTNRAFSFVLRRMRTLRYVFYTLDVHESTNLIRRTYKTYNFCLFWRCKRRSMHTKTIVTLIVCPIHTALETISF